MISSALSRLFTMVTVIGGRGGKKEIKTNPFGITDAAAGGKGWWRRLGQPGIGEGGAAWQR